MKEQKTKNFFKELGDVWGIVWGAIAGVFAAVWNYLRSLRLRAVKQVGGAVLTVIASMILLLDVIIGGLMLTGPENTAEILQSASGFDLFNVVTPWQYVAFVGGALVMEVALWTLVLWLGIWMWKGINYFTKPKYAWLWACGFVVVGLTALLTSMFYAAPSVMQYLGHDNGHHGHDYNFETYPEYYLDYDNPVKGKHGYEYYYPNKETFDQNRQDFDQIEQEILDHFNRYW